MIDGHETGTQFEVRTPTVPIVETVAAHGGNIRSLTFDGTVRVVAEFPHATDTREVLAAAREEVADSMGLASATFHQHLRAAQRKLLVELLE